VDHGLRSAWENYSRESISKVTTAKWSGGVTQAKDCLLCKYEALSSNASPTPPQKKKTKKAKTNRNKGKPSETRAGDGRVSALRPEFKRQYCQPKQT
jgi:hypothetical protein